MAPRRHHTDSEAGPSTGHRGVDESAPTTASSSHQETVESSRSSARFTDEEIDAAHQDPARFRRIVLEAGIKPRPFADDLEFFEDPRNVLLAKCVLELHLVAIVVHKGTDKRRVIYLDDVATVASIFPFLWRIIVDGAILFERLHLPHLPPTSPNVRVFTVRDCLSHRVLLGSSRAGEHFPGIQRVDIVPVRSGVNTAEMQLEVLELGRTEDWRGSICSRLLSHNRVGNLLFNAFGPRLDSARLHGTNSLTFLDHDEKLAIPDFGRAPCLRVVELPIPLRACLSHQDMAAITLWHVAIIEAASPSVQRFCIMPNGSEDIPDREGVRPIEESAARIREYGINLVMDAVYRRTSPVRAEVHVTFIACPPPKPSGEPTIDFDYTCPTIMFSPPLSRFAFNSYQHEADPIDTRCESDKFKTGAIPDGIPPFDPTVVRKPRKRVSRRKTHANTPKVRPQSS